MDWHYLSSMLCVGQFNSTICWASFQALWQNSTDARKASLIPVGVKPHRAFYFPTCCRKAVGGCIPLDRIKIKGLSPAINARLMPEAEPRRGRNK